MFTEEEKKIMQQLEDSAKAWRRDNPYPVIRGYSEHVKDTLELMHGGVGYRLLSGYSLLTTGQGGWEED